MHKYHIIIQLKNKSDKNMKNFSEKLKKALKAKGMTQGNSAKR
jgi:hypothetical protein